MNDTVADDADVDDDADEDKGQTITVWITKYALTAGVQKTEAELSSDGMISVGAPGFFSSCYFRNEWHRTPEAAAAQVEVMRARKLKSLRKAVEKLERLKIEVPE